MPQNGTMLSVAASFTAVGAGAPLLTRHKDRFSYDVSGTFVGTVIIERSLNGGASWEPVVTGLTAAASGNVDVETPHQGNAHYRFRCTAFTSGTIVTALTDVAVLLRQTVDKSGAAMETVKTDGVHTVADAVDTPPL